MTFGATFHVSRTLLRSQSTFLGRYYEASGNFQDPKNDVHLLNLKYVSSLRFLFFFKLRGNFRVSIWSTARHALSRLHDYIPPQRFSVQFCAPIFMKLNMRLKFQKRRFFGMNSSPSSLSFPDLRTCQMQNNLHSASLFLSPFNDSTLGWTGYRSTRC